MRALTARCRSCDSRTQLDDIVRSRSGVCPHCETPWSAEWTLLVVEECEAIENLLHALIRSLRRLSGLPGNLELQPEELLANLTAEVPWHQNIETEPGLIAAELNELTEQLDGCSEIPPSLLAEIRAASERLVRLATMLDANQEATTPGGTTAGAAARHAGNALNRAVDNIEAGDPDSGALRCSLRDAVTTI